MWAVDSWLWGIWFNFFAFSIDIWVLIKLLGNKNKKETGTCLGKTPLLHLSLAQLYSRLFSSHLIAEVYTSFSEVTGIVRGGSGLTLLLFSSCSFPMLWCASFPGCSAFEGINALARDHSCAIFPLGKICFCMSPLQAAVSAGMCLLGHACSAMEHLLLLWPLCSSVVSL